MSLTLQHMTQPVLCTMGIHQSPPPRMPHGPIVELCPCCRKWVYFYGLSAYGLAQPPNLMLPTFPRLLAAMPAAA